MYILYILYMNRGERMHIHISNSGDTPIYEQIVSQIKNLIMKNNLREGEALPSIRFLAKELRISVITTKRAYEELEKSGFITTVAGKGSFVSIKNKAIVKEEQLKQIEDLMKRAVAIAQASDVSKEECIEILTITYDE